MSLDEHELDRVIGAVVNRLRPYLQEVAQETLAAAASRAQRALRIPATVVSIDASTSIVTVLPDTSTDTIEAQSLIGTPRLTSRVMVEFYPPSGVFIVGRASVEPAWDTAWGEIVGGYVEQSGDLASGTGERDFPGLTITLPDGFTPGRKHQVFWMVHMENLHSDFNIGMVATLKLNGTAVEGPKANVSSTSGNPAAGVIYLSMARMTGLVEGDVLKIAGSTSRALVNWSSDDAQGPPFLQIVDCGPE